MYPATQTYWLEPTDKVQVGLRRYVRDHTGGWTCEEGWHDALIITGTAPANLDEQGILHLNGDDTPTDDPRWPAECQRGCGYQFTADDHWQNWQDCLYRRTDTGELLTLRDAPPGACWDAHWMPFSRGPDGISLHVKCPNGRTWNVDSEASNCTRKGEPHHCWVRHGDPRECKITVDKNGDTCAAGAGSIQAGDYHGFLQAGVLTAG